MIRITCDQCDKQMLIANTTLISVESNDNKMLVKLQFCNIECRNKFLIDGYDLANVFKKQIPQ